MKIIFLFVAFSMLVGCASTNRHALNYKSNIHISQVPEPEILQEGHPQEDQACYTAIPDETDPAYDPNNPCESTYEKWETI